MKVIIVSGGSSPSRELLIEELKRETFIICADSGANCLYRYNIVPNYLIGDFDSIEPSVLNHYERQNCCILRYPKDKDYTDTQLALYKAKELGASEIVFLGCTGSRIDHTLGNLGLLLDCLKNGITAYIKDDNNVISITDKGVELVGNKGDYFSLIAYNSPVEGLNISGAKFDLKDYFLNIGDPLTLSNEFINTKVSIDFQKGVMLIIKSKD